VGSNPTPSALLLKLKIKTGCFLPKICHLKIWHFLIIIISLNCYFPKDINIMNAIDQTFGNDYGLQEVIDAACANW
jgi:hypothetical protein